MRNTWTPFILPMPTNTWIVINTRTCWVYPRHTVVHTMTSIHQNEKQGSDLIVIDRTREHTIYWIDDGVGVCMAMSAISF